MIFKKSRQKWPEEKKATPITNIPLLSLRKSEQL